METSGRLWQHYRDEPSLNIAGLLSILLIIIKVFKSNVSKITGKFCAAGAKDVEIMVSLRFLSNFWRALETPLINFEIDLILTWSANYVISTTTNHAISNAKLYVPVANLSTQDITIGIKF